MAGCDGDTEHVVRETTKVNAGEFRGDRIADAGRRIRYRLARETQSRFTFQRFRRQNVDRGADATRWHIGSTRLVNMDARHAFRSQVGEVKRAVGTIVSRHLAAVDGHQVVFRTESTHRHLAALTALPVDRHAGDALQGLRQVRVRELADVFGRNRVDDARRTALDVHGARQTAADANGDNFLDDFAFLRD